MSDAGYVEPDVRYKYTDFSETVFANLAKKDYLGEKNFVKWKGTNICNLNILIANIIVVQIFIYICKGKRW